MYSSRSKVTTACHYCKTKKIRCTGPPECDKCQEKNIICNFTLAHKKRGPRPRVKPEIIESRTTRILKHHPYFKLSFPLNNDFKDQLFSSDFDINYGVYSITDENDVDGRIKEKRFFSEANCDEAIKSREGHEEIANNWKISDKSSQDNGGLEKKETDFPRVQSKNIPREVNGVLFVDFPVEKSGRFYTGDSTRESQKIKGSTLVNTTKRKFSDRFLNSTSASFASSLHSFPLTPFSVSDTDDVNPPILSKFQSEFLINFYFTHLHEWTPVLNQLAFLAQYYSICNQPPAVMLYSIYSAVTCFAKYHGVELCTYDIPMNTELYIKFTNCFLSEEFQSGTLLEKFQASCILYWCVWLGYLDDNHMSKVDNWMRRAWYEISQIKNCSMVFGDIDHTWELELFRRTYWVFSMTIAGQSDLINLDNHVPFPEIEDEIKNIEDSYKVTYEEILQCQYGLKGKHPVNDHLISEFRILIGCYKIIQSIHNGKIKIGDITPGAWMHGFTNGVNSRKIQLANMYHNTALALLNNNTSESGSEVANDIIISAIQLSESKEFVPYSCWYFFCLRKMCEVHMLNVGLKSTLALYDVLEHSHSDQTKTQLAKKSLAVALCILAKHCHHYFINKISLESLEFWNLFCALENISLEKNLDLSKESTFLVLNPRDVNTMVGLFELVDLRKGTRLTYDFDDGKYQHFSFPCGRENLIEIIPSSFGGGSCEEARVHPLDVCQYQPEHSFYDSYNGVGSSLESVGLLINDTLNTVSKF